MSIKSDQIEKKIIELCREEFRKGRIPDYIEALKDPDSSFRILISSISKVMADELQKVVPRKKR